MRPRLREPPQRSLSGPDKQRTLLSQMDEPQKIGVTFTGDRWVTQFGGFYFGGRTLAQLIETLRHTFPKQVLVFAIDRKSVEGNTAAEREMLEVSEPVVF
jgi:hypothetical protein